MLVHLRRTASVLAVVLVGLSLVVLDPNGPSALAYQGPVPAPITWMPNTTTPANTMTPDQWNTALNSNPNKVYTNAGTAGPAGGKVGGDLGAGPVAVAITGLTIGLGVGSVTNDVFGLPTSGNVLCDWGSVLVGSDCGVVASPEYAPNTDVVPVGAGWANGRDEIATDYAYTCSIYQCTNSGPATLRLSITGPKAGEAGTVVMDAAWLTKPASTVNSFITDLRLYWFKADGTLGNMGGSYQIGGNSQPMRWTLSLTAAANARGFVVVIGKNSTALVSGPGASWQQNPPTLPAAAAPLAGTTAYVGEGVSWRPEGTSANPARWWESTWKCSTGTPGGTKRSESFHEGDPEWPGFPASSCDAGAVVTEFFVDQITEGGSTQRVFDWQASPGLTSWATEYPECVSGGCQLLLERIDQVTGKGLSCFANPSLCAEWAKDPDVEKNYRCMYAGRVVGIDECRVYTPTFNPEAPGDYADPEGNEPTQPAPGPGPDPDAPPRDESCPPPFTWTSLVNPWWYYKAGVCVVSEAFTPTQSTVTAWDVFVEDVSARAPVSYMVTGVDWIHSAAGGANRAGSCSDVPTEMGRTGIVPASFDLCTAAVSVRQTTWGTAVYNVVAAGIVGGGLFIAWKRIARSFGGKS